MSRDNHRDHTSVVGRRRVNGVGRLWIDSKRHLAGVEPGLPSPEYCRLLASRDRGGRRTAGRFYSLGIRMGGIGIDRRRAGLESAASVSRSGMTLQITKSVMILE